MYKIKETKSGDFIILYEAKVLWWTKCYYLCARKIRKPGFPSQEECETAHFSANKSLYSLYERLFFESLDAAKEGLAFWQAARNREKIAAEKYINEHTIKENGREIELP